MHRAAVLGQPVAHSLSPALHSAAYAALGLRDWAYSAIEINASELPDFIVGVDPAFVGFSCTMPLKRVTLAVATSASSVATAVGAANTLLRNGAGWRAENTDVDGVLGALAAIDAVPSATTPVLVLGAGGTAQAVLAALAQCGLRELTVAVRSAARATALLATADRLGVTVHLDAFPPRSRAELVVSTVPTGVDVPPVEWPAGTALLDVGYAPWPTPLAAAAVAAGVRVVGGAEMLLHQAARQVELMTGQPAPIAAMRAALPPTRG